MISTTSGGNAAPPSAPVSTIAASAAGCGATAATGTQSTINNTARLDATARPRL